MFLTTDDRADGALVEHTQTKRVPTVRPGILPAATAACGVLSGLVWRTRGPVGWERPFIALLRHEQLPIARPLLLLWQPLPFAIATLWLAWMALKSNRIQLAFSGTAGCVLAAILTERVLKPLVGRHHLHSGSPVFPSGHVTAAAACAMFAWLVFDPPEQLRYALVAVPVMVGYATISTGVHYPADVIAGCFVGGVVVYCIVIGADRLAATAANRRREVPTDDVCIDLPAHEDRTAAHA